MRRMLLALCPLVVLAAGILAAAHGQTIFLTLDTPNAQMSAYFGQNVAVGEVNGDGITDQGRAYVFSLPGTVGGIADLPPLAESAADESLGLADGSGSPAGAYAALAGLAAAMAAGGWYARRRWVR